MPWGSKTLNPLASPWEWWGSELRKTRQARGLSQQALSTKALCDRSYLARFERAERPVPRRAAVDLDQALDACGALVRGWDEAHRLAPHFAGPAATDPERATVSMSDAWGHGVNPGLYGVSSPGWLAPGPPGQAGSEHDDTDTVIVPCRIKERITFVPVPRRTVLASGLAGFAAALPHSPATAATPPYVPAASGASPVEEHTQLRRLLIQSDNLMGPRHVLPAVQQRLALVTAHRKHASGTDAARLLALETRYEELAGWLAQDIGDRRAAYGHTSRALTDSHMTGDSDLTAYILGRQAQLAADTGNPHDALGLATAARRTAPPGSKLEVIAVMHQAHAHSLLGEEAPALNGYDTALALLEQADGDGVWGSWLDAPYVNTARARSLAALGHHDQAVPAFQAAMSALPATYRRDRGVYQARAARSLAGTGDLSGAARTGLDAVGIASETGSARIIEQLGKLDEALARASTEPDVAQFRAALDRIVLHPAPPAAR